MPRHRALILAAALLLGLATPATANHCPDTPGLGEDWCHQTPRPTPRVTPAPTLAPTAPPTARPATARPRTTTRPRTGPVATPEPAVEETPIPTELPPTATPEIVVETPIPEETPESLDGRNTGTSSPAGWAWMVAGLILGWPLGLISGGLIRKRRKKQQIFG